MTKKVKYLWAGAFMTPKRKINFISRNRFLVIMTSLAIMMTSYLGLTYKFPAAEVSENEDCLIFRPSSDRSIMSSSSEARITNSEASIMSSSTTPSHPSSLLQLPESGQIISRCQRNCHLPALISGAKKLNICRREHFLNKNRSLQNLLSLQQSYSSFQESYRSINNISSREKSFFGPKLKNPIGVIVLGCGT